MQPLRFEDGLIKRKWVWGDGYGVLHHPEGLVSYASYLIPLTSQINLAGSFLINILHHPDIAAKMACVSSGTC